MPQSIASLLCSTNVFPSCRKLTVTLWWRHDENQGVPNPVCLFEPLFWLTSKNTSKTALLVLGEVTGGFSSQRSSSAESVSMWWLHHENDPSCWMSVLECRNNAKLFSLTLINRVQILLNRLDISFAKMRLNSFCFKWPCLLWNNCVNPFCVGPIHLRNPKFRHPCVRRCPGNWRHQATDRQSAEHPVSHVFQLSMVSDYVIIDQTILFKMADEIACDISFLRELIITAKLLAHSFNRYSELPRHCLTYWGRVTHICVS